MGFDFRQEKYSIFQVVSRENSFSFQFQSSFLFKAFSVGFETSQISLTDILVSLSFLNMTSYSTL